MICRTFADRVDELIDDVLPPDDAAALREHAAACASCADDLRRAERFRDLLADEGRLAIAAAADHEAAEIARTAPAPETGLRVLARLPLAAAAALVLAAVGLGSALTYWTVGDRVAPTEPETGKVVTTVRGRWTQLGEGRGYVAEEDPEIETLAGDGSRVRLVAGSAVFQVRHGLPFTVETELGDAEVRGTLFQVTRHPAGPVSIAVLSGSVVFTPKGDGPTRTLRRGTTLDVATDGRQRLITRADVDDLELRVDMQNMEILALQGDLDRLREEMEGGEVAPAGGGGTEVVVLTPEEGRKPGKSLEQRWTEVGATMQKLVTLRPDAYSEEWVRAVTPLFENRDLLRETTGAEQVRDWHWHPAIVARSSKGFLESLAPHATGELRERVADRLASFARTEMVDLGPNPSPAALSSARLAMLREFIVATRESLGVDAAAALVDTRPAREIWQTYPFGPDETVRTRTVEWLGRAFDLTADQRTRLGPLVDAWLADYHAARADAEARWGEEAVKDVVTFLRPPEAPSAEPPAAAERVDAYLTRIDVRRALLAPRVAFDAAFGALLTPDQRDRIRASGEPGR